MTSTWNHSMFQCDLFVSPGDQDMCGRVSASLPRSTEMYWEVSQGSATEKGRHGMMWKFGTLDFKYKLLLANGMCTVLSLWC